MPSPAGRVRAMLLARCGTIGRVLFMVIESADRTAFTRGSFRIRRAACPRVGSIDGVVAGASHTAMQRILALQPGEC
ncbi:hypothetical protein GCM10009078_24070 [Cupriavidus gilardii]